MKRNILRTLLSVSLSAAMVMTATPLPAVTVSAATGGYPLGDLDFDGETKASDLTALARAVGGVEALVNEGYTLYNGNAFALGDVDVNGGLAASDLTALSRHVGGVETLPAAGQATTYEGTYNENAASEGLTYELNEEGTGYEVADMGTCTDTDVIVPTTYNGLPVTGIGGIAFDPWRVLTSITIPGSVTNIGDWTFNYCSELTNITFGGTMTQWEAITKGDFWNIETGEYTVTCTDGTLSKSGRVIFFSEEPVYELNAAGTEYAVIGLGIYAAPDVVIPAEWNGLPVTSIGYRAFFDCSGLTSVEIPDSVTSIGDAAFEHCSSLTSITIPNNVTSIGYATFFMCTNLTDVTIPDSVTSIGNSAFIYCNRLKNITYEGTVAQWNAIPKGSYWDVDTGSFTVTCTDGTVAKDGTVTMF